MVKEQAQQETSKKRWQAEFSCRFLAWIAFTLKTEATFSCETSGSLNYAALQRKL
jgi:hypothetical protein